MFFNTTCAATGSRRGVSVQIVSSGREDDKYPCQDSTYQPIALLLNARPKSHTSLGKMDLRRMKEGAMWRIGYVDTVNLRSRMPTTKRCQPTSGLRGPPSLTVFIMVDVREYKPRAQPGRKGSSTRTTLLLSLIYKISPCETRGRFCGSTFLPHIRKKTARQCLGQSGPTPRQRRHHRWRRPP